MEPKSVIRQDFDRSGQYESGLKSLVRSLQWAFAFLLVVIVAMLIYFFTAGGYFSVEPQQAVIVLKFGKYEATYTTGGHWFLPYPVNRFVRVRVNQQQLGMPTSSTLRGGSVSRFRTRPSTMSRWLRRPTRWPTTWRKRMSTASSTPAVRRP